MPIFYFHHERKEKAGKYRDYTPNDPKDVRLTFVSRYFSVVGNPLFSFYRILLLVFV